jgi:ubiquinol-cytochrome c reductase iron-sulfur subunit
VSGLGAVGAHTERHDDDRHQVQVRRADRAALVSLLVAFGGGVLAIAVSIADGSDAWFGSGIALALGGIGFALVAWSKALPIEHEVTEQREPLCVTAADTEALHAHLDEAGDAISRRPVLGWIFGGSLAALAAALVSPIFSLGPSVADQRAATSWVRGRRLVTVDGAPVEVARALFDQLITVFPEGATTADDSQVVLIRVRPELLSRATAEFGTVEGWVAYSKICTHLGCSVGLFGIDTRPPQEIRQLVCPCHQSVFDPLQRARPIGGPATRALPQLPIAADDEGYLIALDDFDEPVGPTTWTGP